jgi:HEAT repeat protein
LAEVARALLLKAAVGDDEAGRDAAISALAGAGSRGREALEKITTAEKRPVARALALKELAAAGDDEARSRLRGLLGSDIAEVEAAAVSVLEPEMDLVRLLEALESPRSGVRLQAARILAGAAPDATARLALGEAARLDPVAAVRARATASLGSYGCAAMEVLEERLGDREESVRVGAIGALVRAGYDRSREILAGYLESSATVEGIESARYLILVDTEIGGGGEEREKVVAEAAEYLYRALGAMDPKLRARAAVTLDGLPAESVDLERVLKRVEEEKVPWVRLSLVTAVLSEPDHAPRVKEALGELMADAGGTGLQAAALLAKQGEDSAFKKLLGYRSDASAVNRRTAARLIAREVGRPHEVRQSLADDDLQVRVAAAGAILSAVASGAAG